MELIDLRPASIDDAVTLAVLSAGAFDPAFGEAWSAEQLAASLAEAASIAHVGFVESGAVGFHLVRCAAEEAELLLVAVAPEQRRRGVAARLIDHAMTAARQRGVMTIFLEVREGNHAGRGLYERQGFITVGRRRGYYLGRSGVRYDAITMRRPL